jgi:hypothetical protein
MRAAAHQHLEALVVLITAYFTLFHIHSPSPVVHGRLFENMRYVPD